MMSVELAQWWIPKNPNQLLKSQMKDYF